MFTSQGQDHSIFPSYQHLRSARCHQLSSGVGCTLQLPPPIQFSPPTFWDQAVRSVELYLQLPMFLMICPRPFTFILGKYFYYSFKILFNSYFVSWQVECGRYFVVLFSAYRYVHVHLWLWGIAYWCRKQHQSTKRSVCVSDRPKIICGQWALCGLAEQTD